MSTLAYGLRAEYLEDGPTPFAGGLIRLDDSRELDTGAALLSGDGIIVIDALDHAAQITLDGFLPLKRVTAPDAKGATVTPYDGKTSAELADALRVRGLPVSGKRDERVARLLQNDDDVAHGVNPQNPAAGADLGVAGQPDQDQAGDPAGDDDDTNGGE